MITSNILKSSHPQAESIESVLSVNLGINKITLEPSEAIESVPSVYLGINKITPELVETIGPIESVISVHPGINNITLEPSEPLQMGNPTNIPAIPSDTQNNPSSEQNNLGDRGDISYDLDSIPQIDPLLDLTEHSEDTNHGFDSTPKIDHLLNISTPNITINSSLCEQQNTVDKVIRGDLEKLSSLRTKNYKNPCISYLNINSLRGNKFAQLKEILTSIEPDILCIDETKLTPDFPTAQFYIEGYHFPPFRRDRIQTTNTTHFGGGKIVYIKGDLISDRLDKYETEHAETICMNLTIKEIKWFILFAYRPESIDRKLFFDEINRSLSKATKDYDNIM